MAEFVAWEESWNDYSRCQHLSEQSQDTRVAAVRQALDEDLRRFIREGTITLGPAPDVADIIAAVKTHIRRQRNPLLDRIEFYNRKQQPSESFDSFLTALKELYNCCDFPEVAQCATCTARTCNVCKDQLRRINADVMRDRLVVGILDDSTRHKLLALPQLTFEEAVKVCRAEEAATVTKSNIPAPGHGHVNAAKKTTYQRQKSKPSPPEKSSGSSPKCPNCGRSAHTKSPCPAQGKTCNGCKGVGHFQAMCRKNPPKAKQETGKLGQLKLCRTSKVANSVIQISTLLATESDPVPLSWIPDTGSDIDAIGVQHLTELGGFVENLAGDSEEVLTANGEPLQSVGTIGATLSVGAKAHSTTIHVYAGLEDALLSRESLQALGFLPSDWPQQIARVSSTSPPDPESVRASLLAEFADVFDDTALKPMHGDPMDIVLEENAVPFRSHCARSIAYAYRDQVKAQLDDMVSKGIIEPVSEPTEWCHPIVVVEKRGTDEKRLTVDFKALNDQVQRPAHPMRTPREALSAISRARWFTKIDARHGYWQVPLSESAKPLTTFITEFGRYRYCRNPQGLISAGDEFNRRTDAAFAHVSNFVKIVDDALIYDGDDFDEHVKHVRSVLQCARDHGITLSRKKFLFAAEEVEFCGYIVNSTGFTVDSVKTDAIQKFPIPSNRTDLRSFFGLVNQFSEFSPSIAEHCSPLRPLLKQSQEFHWDEVHTAAFEATKSALSSPPVLSYYQVGQPLRLETDASVLKGLGYVLRQLQDGQWRLLQCGSRFLSATESRYAIIELELLAAVWAVKKCRLFLSGVRFEVHTDHRPLIPILNTYSLDQIENPRLQRLTLKLRAYQFKAVWRKGTDNVVADALSRNPVAIPTSGDEFGEDPAFSSLSIRACIREDADGRIADLRHHVLLDAARSDDEYQELLQAVQNGFPTQYRRLSLSLRPYWGIREHLAVDNGLVLKGQRIVIPKPCRQQVLVDLHASHQGLTRTKARARQVVYWPKMTTDIDLVVRQCQVCREAQASLPKEPPMNDRNPRLPFECTSADLFSCQGHDFLVFVDRLTGWPCIARTGRTTSSHDVILWFRRWFADVGVPSTLYTDGGPQFASHRFAEFCRRWQVKHIMSSPHYPQSNGHAEAAVKAMKGLVNKTTRDGNLDTDEFRRALLEWRNTPSASGRSPAEKLFGKPLLSFVFAHTSSFAPEWQVVADEVDSSTISDDSIPETSVSARPLSQLKINTHVDIQDPKTKRWSQRGVIVAIGDHRDYYVKLASGRVYWRNRRFLRPYIPLTSVHIPVSAAEPEIVADPPRRSQRSRQPANPFNISSTKGQSYD